MTDQSAGAHLPAPWGTDWSLSDKDKKRLRRLAALIAGILLLLWLLLRRRILDVKSTEGRARYLWPAGATAACFALLTFISIPTVHGMAAAQAQAE